jgi:hypothetical protein
MHALYGDPRGAPSGHASRRLKDAGALPIRVGRPSFDAGGAYSWQRSADGLLLWYVDVQAAEPGRTEVRLIEAIETPASRLLGLSRRRLFRAILRHATGSNTVALALGECFAADVPHFMTDADFSVPAVAIVAWLDAVAEQIRGREVRSRDGAGCRPWLACSAPCQSQMCASARLTPKL